MRQTERNIFPTAPWLAGILTMSVESKKTSKRSRWSQGQLHSHTSVTLAFPLFAWRCGKKERQKKKSLHLQTGKDCLILEETDAWYATHDTRQHVTYTDTQNDTHIIALAAFHLCCHTGFNNLLGEESDLCSHPSSASSLQKKKCFMQRTDTPKKQFHTR